jgi:hypothetical protein
VAKTGGEGSTGVVVSSSRRNRKWRKRRNRKRGAGIRGNTRRRGIGDHYVE